MAHPIDTHEPLPHALRRLAHGDLSIALKRLRKNDLSLEEKVHEARTALKKVRALTRLVRPQVERAAKEDRRLRKIAHTLSDLRDAYVQQRTFDDLVHGGSRGRDTSVRALADLLSQRLDQATRTFEQGSGPRRLRRRLRKARHRVERWLPSPSQDRWSVLGPGLLRGYARAQQAMVDAHRSKTDRAFHAWRRAVKSHRHQIHALLRLFPPDFEKRLAQLDRLDQMLGDEHDLSALKETLHGLAGRVRWNPRCAMLLTSLNERRAHLRSQARSLGSTLFARSLETLRKQWKAPLRAS